MNKKILVTGGSGLLGHALQKCCPEAVYVGSCDYDLRKHDAAERMLKEIKPTHVIHLAANVGGVKKNKSENAVLFSDNALINTNVLDCAARNGVRRLISILSSCCFHVYPDQPSTEEDLHIGTPFSENLGYGYAKRMLDVQSRLISNQFKVRFSAVTPVTMFGPHDNWDLETGHVVAALIHRTLIAAQKKEPLVVWGSGSAIRQFVFSEDVARILLHEINQAESPENIIIAPDDGFTIHELAGVITKLMKFSGEIIFDKSQPGGQSRRVLKSNVFTNRYPDFCFTSFSDALRLTIDWFAGNQRTSGTSLKEARP